MSDLAVTLTTDQLEELVTKATAKAVESLRSDLQKEILLLPECAELLKRHPKVVMTMVRERGLPCSFISDREPRFFRSEVLDWLRAQRAPLPGKDV